MERAAWLLMLAWLPLVGCDDAGTFSVPDEVPIASGDDSSYSATDVPSDGKDGGGATGTSSTDPTIPSSQGLTLETLEPDPLADALDACANGGLDAPGFEMAYEVRLCEEWSACVGTDCVVGVGSEAERFDADPFDVVAACTCLESAWACETSYGTSSEMRVVVPHLACFEVY